MRNIDWLPPVCSSPNWGWNSQPRYEPWLGIKPAVFWCTGQCSNNWATQPRQAISFYFVVCKLEQLFVGICCLTVQLWEWRQLLSYKERATCDILFDSWAVYEKGGPPPKWNYLTWLVWLSVLSACLWTKGSPVQFPVKAHAWIAGQVPLCGMHERQPHTLMILSLSFSLPSLLSKT